MFTILENINPDNDIKNLKNIHENEVAVLVGSGSSIYEKNTKNFFDKANKEKYIYFVNNQAFLFDINKNLFKTDYFIISDPESLAKTKDNIFQLTPNKMKIAAFWQNVCINQKLRLGFKSKYEAYNKYNFCNLNNITNVVLEEFQNIPEINRSSVFITLQIILYSGIKKIYLVGCDCNKGNTLTNNNHNYGVLTNVWKYIYLFLKSNYPDIDIQVVSPKGLKNIIPEYKS